MIQPFTFTLREDTLCGMAHYPVENRATGWCIIVLQGPGTNRTGPHRLHVSISRLLARRGWVNYRFDFRGRGESSGEPEALNVHSMTEDLLAMTAWVKQKDPSVQHVLVIANCLSCIAALKVLQTNGATDGCLLLGAQELHDEPIVHTRLLEAWKLMGKYMRKLWRPVVWKKLWHRHVNMRGVRQSFANTLPARYRTRDVGEKKRVEAMLQAIKSDRQTPYPVCFVYGENDPLKSELPFYEQYCRERHWQFEAHIVPASDRTFSNPAATETVLALTDRFQQQFMDKFYKATHRATTA
jgi:Serine aminopeptidase, S33